jgi:hypothetical protein
MTNNKEENQSCTCGQCAGTNGTYFQPQEEKRKCIHGIERCGGREWVMCNICDNASNYKEEKPQEWEKRFDKKFSYVAWLPEHKQNVLDFIQFELTRQRERMIEKFWVKLDAVVNEHMWGDYSYEGDRALWKRMNTMIDELKSQDSDLRKYLVKP